MISSDGITISITALLIPTFKASIGGSGQIPVIKRKACFSVPGEAFIWASAHRLDLVCVPDAYSAWAEPHSFVANAIYLMLMHKRYSNIP